MLQKIGHKLDNVASTTVKKLTQPLKRNKGAAPAKKAPALPQGPTLEEARHQQLLANAMTTPKPLLRAKSVDDSMGQLSSSQLSPRAHSAPCLTTLVVPASHVEGSAASQASFFTANSKFGVIYCGSPPGSVASTLFYSAASASPAPGSSRAASPAAGEDSNWTILAGRAQEGSVTAPAGLYTMSKKEVLHADYEACLLAAANVPKPAWLFRAPVYIDSSALPRLAATKDGGYVMVYNASSTTAGPRPESPVQVGCFSAVGALLSRLIHRPKKANSVAMTTWEPSATTNKVSLGKKMIKKLVQAARITGESIKAEAQATARTLSTTWGSATNSVSSSFHFLGSSIGGGVDSATAGLRSAGSSMGGALESAGSSFKRRLSSAGDVVEATATGIKERLSSAGSTLGGVLDGAKVASDQAVNHLATKLTLGLTKVADKLKAGAKALKPSSSKNKERSSQGGASYGSEVVVGRFGNQWGIVVSPGVAPPMAA